MSIRLWEKSIQCLRGNAFSWRWLVLDWPPNQKWFSSKLVFRPSTGWSTPVSLIGVIIMKFAHAITRVLKWIKNWAGRGATFGGGVTAPFVASLPAARSRAPTSLCPGGCDCRVVAAPSIPQGVCSLHHGCIRHVGASSYLVSHGRRKVDQKHWKKKIIVRWNSWREMLFELSHENTGFEALHFHGKAE